MARTRKKGSNPSLEDSSDLHCSLGDGRSFTDPVTNWTLISGVKLDRDLIGMMQAGKYPIRYLPDFVHELLHHQCFHSPVGLALTLLQLRARRRSLLLQSRKDESDLGADIWSVLDDVVRYETAISLMRPLAEGLALYAEFDALPGESPVISQAMLMTGVSFVDFKNDKDQTEDGSLFARAKHISKLLISHRLEKEFHDRKINLLVRPFSTERGGYLPGYLTVKNLWYCLVRQMQSEKFFDTDLFLNYLRTFFYEDYAFVAVLLDPDKEISSVGAGSRDSAEAISRYFQQRLTQLVRFTTQDEVSHFEQAILGDPEEYYSRVQFGAPPSLAERGRQLLEEWVQEIDFDGPINTMEEMLLRRDHWTLAQRHLMCIGSFEAPIRVNEYQRVLVGEYTGSTGDFQFPIFAAAALPDAPQGSGRGSVEFFLSPAGQYSVLTVTLNDRVVAIYSLSPNFTDTLKDDIVSYRASHSSAMQERSMWRSLVTEMLEADSTTSIYLEHYRKNARKIADAFYLPKALLYTPDASLTRAINALRKNGFYHILGEDYDLIRALARLSLVNAINMTREAALKWLAEDGCDFETVRAALQRCEKKTGLRLVEEYENNLACYF
jgi:hypothetical protein